jgi:hypothetical protein
MKRTRSDQSLAGACCADGGGGQLADVTAWFAPQGRVSGSSGSGDDLVGGAHIQGQAHAVAAAALAGRLPPQLGGWLATLPAVLSDHGSSSNSLVSLESDLARSSASQPALQQLVASGQQQRQQPSSGGVSHVQTIGMAAGFASHALDCGDEGAPGSRAPPAQPDAGRPRSDTVAGGSGEQLVITSSVVTSRACTPPPLISPAGPARAPALSEFGAAGTGWGMTVTSLRPVRCSAAPSAAAAAPVTCVALDAGARRSGSPAVGKSACTASIGQEQALPSWGLGGSNAPQAFAAAAAFGGGAGMGAMGGGWGQAGGGRGRAGACGGAHFAPAMQAFAAPAAGGPQPVPAIFGRPSASEQPCRAANSVPSAAAPTMPDAGGAAAAGDGWDFARRSAQQRAASKASGANSTGRRRSSIEQSMPWRAKLEDAIAAAASDGEAAAGCGGAGAGAGGAPGQLAALGGLDVVLDASAGGAGGPQEIYVPGGALSPEAVAERPGQRSSTESEPGSAGGRGSCGERLGGGGAAAAALRGRNTSSSGSERRSGDESPGGSGSASGSGSGKGSSLLVGFAPAAAVATSVTKEELRRHSSSKAEATAEA